MDGKATFTIVASMATMNRLRQHVSRTTWGRSARSEFSAIAAMPPITSVPS